MPKATQQDFEYLLEKAAKDRKFRDALVNNPIDAAKELPKPIVLNEEDVLKLDKVKEAALRFGGKKKLHPEDARAWAVGLLNAKRVC